MQKTQFAGITILDPSESVTDDGGAFTGKDRQIIDHFLGLGAKYHRHNGASGLADPTAEIDVEILSSGGSLASDSTFSIGYTLEDSSGGETVLSPVTTVSTPQPISPPTESFDATFDSAAGVLLFDTYYYAISYLDQAGGETPVGPVVGVTREPGFADGQILLSGLTDGMATASAGAWRLYRAIGGDDLSFLAQGSANTFTDDGSLAGDPTQIPLGDDVNTTNSLSRMRITLPILGDWGGAQDVNVYISEDGDFVGPCFLGQYPQSSAGSLVTISTIDLDDQSPPDVSTSVGGADQIDPDTDILDWHWKRPVPTEGDLPAGEAGDVRLATEEGIAYYLAADGTDWAPLAGGGGGGGGGAGSGITVVSNSDSTNAADVLQLDFGVGYDVITGWTINDFSGEAEAHLYIQRKPDIPQYEVTSSQDMDGGFIQDIVKANSGSAMTLTMQADSFPVGCVIDIYQGGAGTVTIAAGSGVTINSLASNTDIAGQYGTVRLIQTDTNEWLLSGDLA